MEKRFYFGMGILLFFLILGLFVSWGMQEAVRPVTRLLEQAAEAAHSGETARAARLAQQARDLWDDRWGGMALAADHEPMDEIDGLFAQIVFFAHARDGQRLGACCARVAELVEAMADAHTLRWRNVL